jgi:hypothetical protein
MEHDEQAAFHDYLTRFGSTIGCRNFFAIPNAGKRGYGAVYWFQKEGMRRGVPDYAVMHARSGFHGLFFEFKYGDNRQSPEQREWELALSGDNYLYVVVYDAQEAMVVVRDYMAGEGRKHGPTGVRSGPANRKRGRSALPDAGVHQASADHPKRG